ncbi:MAG: response regulator transcription factor [Chitinophagaceae bacterium]|nr:response regulator transcription factor [Chitinophagaceae bacterium]
MTKILIADDHSAIRNGVRHILSGEFSFIEFAEASDVADCLRYLVTNEFDILILDIDLPGRNGFEVLSTIQSLNLKTKTLIFSFHKEEQIALRSYKNGAFGYLNKDIADKELIQAVNQILAGKKYITPQISELLLQNLNHPEKVAPHETLSNREFQTLLLIASGKSVSEIATELSLSLPTISTYRARILEKMQMKNNAELTNYVYKNNLL